MKGNTVSIDFTTEQLKPLNNKISILFYNSDEVQSTGQSPLDYESDTKVYVKFVIAVLVDLEKITHIFKEFGIGENKIEAVQSLKQKISEFQQIYNMRSVVCTDTIYDIKHSKIEEVLPNLVQMRSERERNLLLHHEFPKLSDIPFTTSPNEA